LAFSASFPAFCNLTDSWAKSVTKPTHKNKSTAILFINIIVKKLDNGKLISLALLYFTKSKNNFMMGKKLAINFIVVSTKT